jgi:conserved hypothetical protein
VYGELIRNARQRKGWTLSDLAYKLGITPAGIAQWEQNRRNPKLETREKIASALDIDITELMLEPEKSDYEKRFGTSESRAASAAYQIERIIEANTKRIESCNGVVTTNHKKDWALDDIEVIARKYGVPTSSIKKQLNIDLSLGLDEAQTDSVPKSKTYYKGRFVSEIDAIMAGLNEDGREAVLRHARELAKIPEYQKNYDQRNH